ncbi:StsA family sactipeptide RiPP [Virgisporangium aurantiacum]
MTQHRWHKPQMVRTEFAAQMSCACACGMLVGAGSGNGDTPRDPCGC